MSKPPVLPRSFKAGPLTMWTLYWSPLDYPGRFVVRRWVISRAGGEPVSDPEPLYVGPDDRAARSVIPNSADACIRRSPADDPAIVETWF